MLIKNLEENDAKISFKRDALRKSHLMCCDICRIIQMVDIEYEVSFNVRLYIRSQDKGEQFVLICRKCIPHLRSKYGLERIASVKNPSFILPWTKRTDMARHVMMEMGFGQHLWHVLD